MERKLHSEAYNPQPVKKFLTLYGKSRFIILLQELATTAYHE